MSGYTPGQLIFSKDMIMQNVVTADWGKIKLLKSNAAIESIVRENASRLSHNYTVGDKVSILISRDEVKSNTDQPTEGPFDIVKVYPSHGTVKIQTGIYQEVIQIRRLKPYHE